MVFLGDVFVPVRSSNFGTKSQQVDLFQKANFEFYHSLSIAAFCLFKK